MNSWPEIKERAGKVLNGKDLGDVYSQRLAFEFDEIEKQGAERQWEEIFGENKTYESNPNMLVLPWLLDRVTGDANVDPIATRPGPVVLSSKHTYITKMIAETGTLPFDVAQDDDKPDIDIDCLPYARDVIKEYAASRYGIDNVASVGTWQTYLFKAAIGDAYRALGLTDEDPNPASRGPTPHNKAIMLTRDLPDDINEMRDGGYGVCKGKVSDDGGVERDCGYKHNEVACPECTSEDTETPTLARLLRDYPEIQDFIDEHPRHREVIDVASRLVGRVQHMGKHAGAIIIADRNLFGNVPMSYDKKANQWVSLWTEGRNPQLSKFGYNKWDILGLKNLLYIYECCGMVEANHGVSFGEGLSGLGDSDPEDDRAGVFWKDGKKHKIELHDEKALALANSLRTDAIFQFDTELAKRILSNGVRSFWDLLIFNAMGHPGPMAMIPDYVNRRDDESASWKKEEHPLVAKILGDTQGTIVFQEQLTTLWQEIAGFTGPEAQFARKAVAKKWRDKLKPVKGKWIDGASKIIGESAAIEWWDKMESFGRYAFNRSHSVSYCLTAYYCLWLKAYYPEEWWAAVMGYCHQNKLERYMSSARTDGVKFGEINIGRMTIRPVANAGANAMDGRDVVAMGLINLKKVGDAVSGKFADEVHDPDSYAVREYDDLDDFVDRKGKNKVVLERLIKLGAFSKLHNNARALWKWYLHKYCTGALAPAELTEYDKLYKQDEHGNFKPYKLLIRDDKGNKVVVKVTVAMLKEHHRATLLMQEGWTREKIEEERARQVTQYKATYPKRNKLPAKILNWKPDPKDTRDRVMGLYEDDYDLERILAFEKEFLGYYWHSPCDLYYMSGDYTIDNAKMRDVLDEQPTLEGVVVDRFDGQTRNNNPMVKLIISDGHQDCLVIIWSDGIGSQDPELMKKDAGVRMRVNYDEARNSFTLARGAIIGKLWTAKGWAGLQDGDVDGD